MIRILCWALAAVGLAVLVAAVVIANACGIPPLGLLDFISSFSMLGSVLLAIAIPVVAFVPLGNERSGGWPPIVLWCALGFGWLLTLYGEFNTALAIKQTHTTNFQVYGPSIASDLPPLGLGLLVAAVCAFRMTTANRRAGAVI
jgi:hypothetical protein